MFLLASKMRHGMLDFDYQPGEILELCRTEVRRADERIALLDGDTFETVFEPFETVIADLLERVEPALFMMNVHTAPAIREEAKQAQEIVEKYFIELHTRKELYLLLKEAAGTASGDAQRRLADKILRDFRRNGLDNDSIIPQVRALNERLAELKADFKANLNRNADFILADDDEIEGLPEHFIARLERTANGVKILTNAADVVPFMTHCKSPAARRRMLDKYDHREAATNTPLLQEAVRIRRDLAALLGYAHWADYSTEEKMSKDAQTVLQFIDRLHERLVPLHRRDLELLQARKSKDYPGERLDPWDVLYYENILREERFGIDDEAIREFFPAEHVIARMFSLYSKMFAVEFKELEAPTWAQGVKLHEIRGADGRLIAHFYTDFFPRQGKYNHFAAFNLRDSRRTDDGHATPVAAIVCNFTPPSDAAPSLLSHDEVVTLFHEFGHIMHTTLCDVPYASLAAFKTAWDFVEAPSQMLENWAWTPTVIKDLSSHYKTGDRLPDTTIERLVASRSFLEGYAWMRQIFFSLYDLRIHIEPHDDLMALFRRMYKDMLGLDPLPDTHWPATWGHIMGGYEAGYYTYTWSKVIAQDLFTRFEREGALDPAAGMAYRRHILAPGDMRDADVLIEEFLGRKRNEDAFLRLILDKR